MIINNQNTSGYSFNVFNPELTNDVNTKLNEDRYEVYVNGNLVGEKSLKNQGEGLTDLDDFLHSQGFNSFISSVDGDHYNIQAKAQEGEIINALAVYFNNR
jgi:hypothetical protein